MTEKLAGRSKELYPCMRNLEEPCSLSINSLCSWSVHVQMTLYQALCGFLVIGPAHTTTVLTP